MSSRIYKQRGRKKDRMNNDFVDIRSARNITTTVRQKTSIEQINDAIIEAAKEGWYMTEVTVHNPNETTVAREIVRFKDDDLEVVWLRDAGYKVRLSDEHKWWSISICWAEGAEWNEEEGEWSL